MKLYLQRPLTPSFSEGEKKKHRINVLKASEISWNKLSIEDNKNTTEKYNLHYLNYSKNVKKCVANAIDVQ